MPPHAAFQVGNGPYAIHKQPLGQVSADETIIRDDFGKLVAEIPAYKKTDLHAFIGHKLYFFCCLTNMSFLGILTHFLLTTILMVLPESCSRM